MTGTSATPIQFCVAQLDFPVGAMEANGKLIVETVRTAEQRGVQAVIFPELTLTGYIPEDLLFRSAFLDDVVRAREYVCEQLKDCDVWALIGYPRRVVHKGHEGLANTLGVVHRGKLVAEYDKRYLPNDELFDEKRYFVSGTEPAVCNIGGVAVGLCICEDVWHPEPCKALADAGAEMVVSVSVSPFARDKYQERIAQVRARTQEVGLPIIYATGVGAQDELVFDGGSFAMDSDGKIQVAADRFKPEVYGVTMRRDAEGVRVEAGYQAPDMEELAAVYQALQLGLADYVRKNGFEKVVLGLSGGIDSALSLAIAVDALGADSVLAVQMPSVYTSEMSLLDSAAQAKTMGVRYINIGIEEMRAATLAALKDEFANTDQDLTEENIQARCRGMLLMAISNKHNSMLLSTGNKSELAVGYATLYGDMAGGFNAIKDVLKTWVYKLAHYRNSLGQVIPERVITRAPSAELRPEQKDSDSLPDYDILDQVIERHVERKEDIAQMIAAGLDRDIVCSVVQRIQRNEYKRQQAAIGVRVSSCSFSRRDRRLPVSCAWDETAKS